MGSIFVIRQYRNRGFVSRVRQWRQRYFWMEPLVTLGAQRPKKCPSGCPVECKEEDIVGRGQWGEGGVEKRETTLDKSSGAYVRLALWDQEEALGTRRNTWHYPVRCNGLPNGNILLHVLVINLPAHRSRQLAPDRDVFLEASRKAGSTQVRMSTWVG